MLRREVRRILGNDGPAFRPGRGGNLRVAGRRQASHIDLDGIVTVIAQQGDQQVHLRRTWAPLTVTDQNPPAQDNPVTPARRSAHAQAKASCQRDPAGRPYRSFRGLLEHLATLTRNQVRFTGTQLTVAMLAEPTSDQR